MHTQCREVKTVDSEVTRVQLTAVICNLLVLPQITLSYAISTAIVQVYVFVIKVVRLREKALAVQVQLFEQREKVSKRILCTCFRLFGGLNLYHSLRVVAYTIAVDL